MLQTRREAPPFERPEGRWGLFLGTGCFLAFALLPLLGLLLYALPGEPAGRLGDPLVQAALRLSVVTSLVSTLLCVAMGLPVAYLLSRSAFRGRAVVDTLIDLPMTLPPVVAGVALLLAFGRMHLLGRHLAAWGIQIPFTMAAVVLAQTFMAAPFFIRTARAGFSSVPISLEHAAMTLGRSRWGVFWSISVPLAMPALLAGVVLAWARALSEFGATMLFAGNLPGVTQTLPLAVMAAFDAGDLPLAAAISLVSLGLAFGALLGARILSRGAY